MNSVCTISQLQLEQKLRAKLNLYNKIMLQNFLIFYYIDNFFFSPQCYEKYIIYKA